jgi:cytochrome bd-type quinol oxidase subunit 2
LVREDGGGGGWSGIAFAASILYLGGTWLAARVTRGEGEEAARLAVAPLAVATAVFAAIAVALEIGRGWPAIAVALVTPLLMMLTVRLRLPSLGGLALASALLSLGGALYFARDFGFPGDLPWQLYGFGVPFLALAAAAWTGRRNGLEATARMEWLVVLSGGLLATLLVRELAPGATTAVLVAVFLVPLLAFTAWRLYRRKAAA